MTTTAHQPPTRRVPADRVPVIITALAVPAVLALVMSAVMTGLGPLVTRPALERSVAASFAQRSHLQAELLDAATATSGGSGVAPAVNCQRGGPTTPDVGAGEDWVCRVSASALGRPAVPSSGQPLVQMEMRVLANGCWSAIGAEPVLGPPVLHRLDGRTVPNPLLAFDGCLRPAPG